METAVEVRTPYVLPVEAITSLGKKTLKMPGSSWYHILLLLLPGIYVIQGTAAAVSVYACCRCAWRSSKVRYPVVPGTGAMATDLYKYDGQKGGRGHFDQQNYMFILKSPRTPTLIIVRTREKGTCTIENMELVPYQN